MIIGGKLNCSESGRLSKWARLTRRRSRVSRDQMCVCVLMSVCSCLCFVCVSRRVQAPSCRRSWGGGRRNWQPAPVIQGWSLSMKAAPTELHPAPLLPSSLPLPSLCCTLSFFFKPQPAALSILRQRPTARRSWRSCGVDRNSSAHLHRNKPTAHRTATHTIFCHVCLEFTWTLWGLV